jgi:branched-chain amino acid transport system substrate-binding protein
VLAQAVEATKSLDPVVIAGYIRSHSFGTVVGDITFGKDGESAKSPVGFTQFQNVTGNTLDQFKDTTHEVVVWPDEYKSGNMIYPCAKAKSP